MLKCRSFGYRPVGQLAGHGVMRIDCNRWRNHKGPHRDRSGRQWEFALDILAVAVLEQHAVLGDPKRQGKCWCGGIHG